MSIIWRMGVPSTWLSDPQILCLLMGVCSWCFLHRTCPWPSPPRPETNSVSDFQFFNSIFALIAQVNFLLILFQHGMGLPNQSNPFWLEFRFRIIKNRMNRILIEWIWTNPKKFLSVLNALVVWPCHRSCETKQHESFMYQSVGTSRAVADLYCISCNSVFPNMPDDSLIPIPARNEAPSNISSFLMLALQWMAGIFPWFDEMDERWCLRYAPPSI